LINDDGQLTVIQGHSISSQGQIRELVGEKSNRVAAAIARLLGKKLITREKQREPFELTELGRDTIS